MKSRNTVSPDAQAVRIGSDQKVHVDGLVIDSGDVASFLSRAPDAEIVERFIAAVEVGVSCLERATAGRDMDFVKRQLQNQVHVVLGQIQKIPANLADELKKYMGTKEGQVLAPVAALIGTTEKVLKDRLAAVNELLARDLDPGRTDSTLGKALGKIAGLLDPDRENSVQKSLEGAVAKVAGDDGAIAAVLKKVLDAELKPLGEEIDRLAKEIRTQDAAEAALADTIEKGEVFEEELLPTIQCWSRFAGAAVDHVGGDRKPGDILVTVNDSTLPVEDFVIVVEARNDATARGRKRIADHMAEAMKIRDGHFGIYVAKTQGGLAKEIGDWSEGTCASGPFIACIADHLVTALRFAIVQTRIQALFDARPETDTDSIRCEVDRIRTAVRRVRTIKAKSSDIHKNADAVHQAADKLQREINDALLVIENALRGSASAAA
ncbi:MAG: hypothetical protein V3W34_17280 [Phycisphaerae bacterium]